MNHVSVCFVDRKVLALMSMSPIFFFSLLLSSFLLFLLFLLLFLFFLFCLFDDVCRFCLLEFFPNRVAKLLIGLGLVGLGFDTLNPTCAKVRDRIRMKHNSNPNSNLSAGQS